MWKHGRRRSAPQSFSENVTTPGKASETERRASSFRSKSTSRGGSGPLRGREERIASQASESHVKPEEPQEMNLTQEIRFAVVMYGGISLAIYMNGVAQELLKLVRATAPASREDNGTRLAAHRDDTLSGTERVYRKLGKILSRGAEVKNPKDVGPEDPITTRFVVDILSGSSAGGINAVYLAKALVNDQSMDKLKDLWIDEGDIAVLINDEDSLKGTPFTQQDQPRSLLSSTRMYSKLLDALKDMEDRDDRDGNQPPSQNVEELDLYVTATDMKGRAIRLQLADKMVKEYRHRNVFRFRYSIFEHDHSNGEGVLNDFGADSNPFLAYAARCTSAHPAAFDPMRLGDVDEVLTRDPFYADKDLSADKIKWRRFFEEYLRPKDGNPEDLAKNFLKRDFNDGGVLDNRPFRHATDAMPLRHARVPVSRKLMYIDPAPERPRPEPNDESPRPSVVDNAWLSLSTLPRYEPIQEDLQRVLERNRLIERVGTIVEGMERIFLRASLNDIPSDEDGDGLTRTEMIEAKGLAWAGYQHLRVTQVTDDVALLIVRVARLDEDSDEFRAIRHLVRCWRERRFDPDGANGKRTEHEFLAGFDVMWHLRHLKFVLAKIDEMFGSFDRRRDLVAQATCLDIEGAGQPTLSDETLWSIRAALNKAYTSLRESREHLWEAREDHPLQGAIDGLEPQTAMDLDELVKGMVEEKQDRFEEFSEVLQDHIGRALRRVFDRCEEILPAFDGPVSHDATGEEIARRTVRYVYDSFGNYDMISYPILYATGVGEERAPVDVFRISPEDADSLMPEEPGKPKLAGTKLNNFAAFFKQAFRTNDIVWGQLDGSERIITALLPNGEDEPTRTELIREAHRAIIAEEVFAKEWNVKDEQELRRLLDEVMAYNEAEATRETVESLHRLADRLRASSLSDTLLPPLRAFLKGQDPLDYFKEKYRREYSAVRRFDLQSMVHSAARGSKVFGDMLAGNEETQRRLSVPERGVVWVTRLVQVFWLLVEVAVTGSLPNLVFRHGLKLLYFFEALTIVLGTLLLNPTIQQFGIVAFALTATIHGAVVFLEDEMGGKKRWRRIVTYVAASAAALLVALGLILVLAALGLNWPQHLVEFLTEPGPAEEATERTLARGVLAAVAAVFLWATGRGTLRRLKSNPATDTTGWRRARRHGQ